MSATDPVLLQDILDAGYAKGLVPWTLDIHVDVDVELCGCLDEAGSSHPKNFCLHI